MRLGSEVLKTDLYAILGVPEGASREQIKRAWRRLAMRSHPDLAGVDRAQAERTMARINVAAGVLLDPERRAAYDRHRRVQRVREAPAPFWPPVEDAAPEWVQPEPARRSWIPSSAELATLLRRIRPLSGRVLLEIAETARAWPPKRHAFALAICLVMALSLIAHARPRSLAFLYEKVPAAGVAYPKGV